MSDSELVSRARSGDERAFQKLIELYSPPCWRYACAMLGDADDASDVLQDAVWKAYRALPRYQDDGRFHRWLFMIVANQCRNRLHANNRRSARRAPVSDAALIANPMHDADRNDRVASAMDALPTLLREAIVMKFGEDLDYQTMADLTGASVSALKMRVSRGLEQMRTALGNTAAELEP